MKKNLSSLLIYLLLLLALFSYITAADTCPSGMRKYFLDDQSSLAFGAARIEIPAVTFCEGNGALWYDRKVLIEPRFEIHLKVSLNKVNIIESTDEQILEGFTMVISGLNNKVGSGTPENIGYSGFSKSYIMEFDFNQNSFDPDSNSYSFKYCASSCTGDDGKAIYKGRLPNQKFDPTKNMNWDFRLIYSDHKITVYSGPNTVLYEYYVDLSSKLGTLAYVGFTGYQRGNRRELNLLGTFICEDNYDLTKMKGSFVVDGKKLSTATYKAGNKIYYSFSFVNNRGENVPHCYKTNVWTYDFSLSVDCKTPHSISVVDDYTLLFTLDACDVIGKHSIGLKEANHGTGLTSYYDTIPNGLEKITLIGHDGIITDIDQQIDVSNGARILKYGTANGDFPFKSGLTFVLDFDMTDNTGNKVKIGDTSDNMLTTSELSLANPQFAKYYMKQFGDHYQFIFTVSAPGVYQIPQNKYMEESYEVKVVEGEVDSQKSYCTLDGYTYNPTLKKGDKVTLVCFLSDSFGNPISYSKFRDNSAYDFSCNVERTSPGIATIYASPKEKNGNFACDYTADEAGEYKFKGYLNKKKSSTKNEITPKINSFTVQVAELSLIGAKIYNPYTRSWQNIDDASLTYKSDYTGFITALDLTDSTHTMLMSSLGTLPAGFDVSTVSAILSSPHDPDYPFGKLKTKVTSINGIQYVGVYTADGKGTDSVIKKSSFDYRLQFYIRTERKNVPLIYKFEQPHTIGNYITCFHDLDELKTIVDFETISLSKNAGETYLGNLILQTEDNYLYNYDIGSGNIQLRAKESGFSYKIVPDTILGIYQVYASTTVDLNNNIDLYINGKLIKSFKASSQRLKESCTMRLLEPSYVQFSYNPDPYNYWYEWKGPLTPSGNLKFNFFLFDRYKNLITEPNFKSTYTDIYCHSFGTDETKYIPVTYDSATKTYVFEDKITQYGKYEWVIFCRDHVCNNKTIISYVKGQGGVEVDISKSYFTILRHVIYEGEYAYVDVFLKDSNGQNIGQNRETLASYQKSVVVRADGKDKVNMDFEQITGALALRYKKRFDKQGQYIVSVTYSGKNIESDDKMLTVKSNGIDLDASIVQMITDRTIDLSVDREETVDNNIHVPFYRLYLYNVDGDRVNFDTSLDVSADFSDSNGNKWNLLTGKESNLYVQFTHDSNTKKEYSKFPRGHYFLTVYVAGKSKQYKIYLVGNGDDGSNAKDYDNDLTEYSTLHIYGEAGVTYPVNVEFRDKDGWRWNTEVDPTLFTVKNSYDLKADKLSVIFQPGGKNGQFIININQKVVTSKDKNNYLTISYNGRELNKKIALTIYSSKLFKLKYDSGLRDGTVEDLPIIKLIPVDKYDNICQDIFDSSKTNQAKIDSLTTGRSLDGVLLGTNNFLTENKYLNVQYQTNVPTTIHVSSSYYDDSPDLTYKILPGEVDPDKTFAQLYTSGANTAGGTYVIMIYPRDKNDNEINNLTPEDLAKFKVNYDIDGANVKDISDTCELVEGESNSFDVEVGRRLATDEKNYNQIKCSTPITTAGTIEFHVTHVGDDVECRYCIVSIVANEIDFTKTKTIYVNKNYVMDENKQNPTESKILPTWKLIFRDKYGNEIHDSEITEKLDVSSFLGDVPIRLCVTDSSYTKLINVCKDQNGDDNQNKWYYLTNGDDYTLNVTEPKLGKLGYPLTITGNDNDKCKTGEVDLSKTTFDPNKLTLMAGEEGSTVMTLHTTDGDCWNYWYPNVNDIIKVKFDEDQDTCESRVAKGNIPSEYKITVSCTKKNDNNGFKVSVNGTDVPNKVQLEIKSGYSYYLEPLNPDLFIINDKTFTFKTNPTNDDTVKFNFKLLDKYRNYLDFPTLPASHTDVASEKYGSNNEVWEAAYDPKTESYAFTDKTALGGLKTSWYFTCLESNNRYTFTYTKIPGKVDPGKSSYTVDKPVYYVQETSYVEVTLKDSFGMNIEDAEKRLNKEKDNVKVIATGAKDVTYEFDSITDHKTIKYKYTYGTVGNYDVSVLYNNKNILPVKTPIKVIYPEISLDKSKLFINKNNNDKEILMDINSPTTVNNTVEYPFFRLELYTKDGEKIVNYDKSTNFTCVMRSGDIEWPLTTTKNDDHVRFDYIIPKEEYANLPKGEYPLVVYINGEPKAYKLLLLGSEKTDGYSPDPDYRYFEVIPNYIEGIVGNEYSVTVQMKAKDGLNWNYYPNPSLVSIANSYGFNSKVFSYNIEIPEEKGKFIIKFIQTKVSPKSNPNRMIITYNGEKVPTEVEIVMKHGELKKLVYFDGLRNGTVEDYPTLRFIPQDEFANLVTDLFDPKVYDHAKLQGLTKGTSVEGYDLGSNNFVTDNQYLNVQYQSTKPTTIKVTSDYFPETYTYTLFAGGIDPDKTYAELMHKDNPIAGDIQDIMIYPKDEFGNPVESLTEDEKDKFIVTYTTPDNKIIDISNTCRVTDEYRATTDTHIKTDKNAKYNKIQCSSPVTIAGPIEFHVDYVDDPVECRKCQTNIGAGEIDFSKTTSLYKNTNVNMSRTIHTKVSAKELPTFVLTFYDKYWNKITDEKKVSELDVDTEMTRTDVDLCVSDFAYNKLSNVCGKDQQNVNKWFYLVDGDFYKFIVSKKDEQVIFPVEIVDGYKSGSNDPLDPDKIYLNPTQLTLYAGQEGKINLELRTAQEERKNFWFDDHNESIKVKFAEDEKYCKYNIVQGEEPGQYVIKVSCTKKRDHNKVTVTVEGKEVPQKVDLTILAGDPYSSKLFTLDDVEITKPDLGKVPVTDELKIKEVFYDRYDNLIDPIEFSTNILEIKFGPTVAKKPDTVFSATTNIQGGAVIITMKSTLAAKHKLTGKFFPLPEYYVTFIHGPPSDKSILDVDKTVVKAGEPVKPFIIPYDDYGNRIDAHEFETNNPFTVYYRPEGENNDINIPKFQIEEMDGGSVISYPTTFTKAGVTKVSGFINDSPLNTKDVTVLPADMDFLKSKVYRFNPNLKEFEILKNGTVEKNNETDPIYRLFPVDKYGNDIEFIPEEKLKALISYLNSQAEKSVFYHFKLNNKDTKEQPFAEFVKNDDDKRNTNSYRTLVGGFYDLIFSDGKDKLPYNITLGNSNEGSNLPEDIQNTLVFPDLIRIKAGDEGNVFVQIKTKNNETKSVWDGYSIKIESCDKTDQSFKYVEQGAGSIGTFLVTVTSQKANTYPTIEKCPLNVYVNGVLVQNQHPLFEVYADVPYSTQILEKYWKDPKSSEVLVDGTADTTYVFEVKSFDKYGNLCETIQEIVGISVSLLGDDVKTTSENVPTTGYRKYNVAATIAGVYTITSKINSATNKQYLPNDSIFNIYPGEIDLSKVIVQERANIIKAGEKPEISIIAFDKHGNRIEGVNLQDKFDVIFTDANSNKHETTNAVNDKNTDQVIYTSATPVTVIGYVRPTVAYRANSQIIDTSHIKILVVAGDPDPKNSKLSRMTSSGTVTVYKNGDKIPCNVNNPPVFNITLYDKYDNYIETIPEDVEVIDPTMSGNSMTPIVFNVENKVSFFNLDFNKDEKSLQIYSHLVKGDYDFIYDVKTDLDKANFKYTIVLDSPGDNEHGNGDIDKLIITPTNKTFYAGDYEYFTLELRTKDGLLYNNEVDVNAIKLALNVTEKSFKYEISPTSILGNYTISIYCEKKGRYEFDAQLNDKKSNKAFFRVKPALLPFTPYTQILTYPPEEVAPEDKIEITFKLADKFNNTFEERDDIIDKDYLIVTNNNQSVPQAEKELLDNKEDDDDIFKVTLDPIYPPLVMHINSIYNDGVNSIPCFPEDIVVKINTELDLNHTIAKSRNAITIYVGDILDMRLYTYDGFGFCKEEEDYSSKFKVVVKGPLDIDIEIEKIY